MTPVRQTVSILDSHDGHDLLALFNLGRRDLAQADVANLAPLLHALQRAQRLFERGARINSVLLVEIDAVEAEPAQAHLDTLDQIAGTANIFGLCRALARDAPLVAMTTPVA